MIAWVSKPCSTSTFILMRMALLWNEVPCGPQTITGGSTTCSHNCRLATPVRPSAAVLTVIGVGVVSTLL